MKPPREPIAMNATVLLLLPAAPEAAATSLQLDSGGRVLARRTIEAGASLATDASQPPTRQVLAVPGNECLSTWLALPARNPVQAVAAARVLLAEHVAGPLDTLHLAIAPAADDSGRRLVVAVESATMRAWLDRAATFGMTPDVVVPLPMLLPPADDAVTNEPGELVIADIDGHWLVRGPSLAFAVEPVLAEQVVGARPRRVLTAAEAEAAFAAAALSPPIDLLQLAFAPKSNRREGWPAWRRAAILAMVLMGSPLVLLAAQAVGHELAARDLHAQAHVLGRTLLPALEPAADPLPPLRARLAELRSGDGFTRAAPALLAAVAATNGAELDALAYANGELQATLAVPAPDALEQIRRALAAAGLELTETGRRDARGRNEYAITVKPSA